MTTTVPPQAKPPGLPLGRVRTGWQLLVRPNLLSGETLFGDGAGDLVHWRVGRQHFFASRSPDHVEHVFVAGHDRYQKAVHYRLIAAVTGEAFLTGDDIEALLAQPDVLDDLVSRARDLSFCPDTGRLCRFADRIAAACRRSDAGTAACDRLGRRAARVRARAEPD